jgi:aminopeptidase N
MILLLSILSLMSNLSFADNLLPEKGVSRELARARAVDFSKVGYSIKFTVTPGADRFAGHNRIRVTLKQPAQRLVLDWRSSSGILSVKANGRPAKYSEQNDHLIVEAPFALGENIVDLEFHSLVATSGRALTRYIDREDKSEYIYSLFVPSDASTVFPCFDQPDLKAEFELELLIPPSWKAISNSSQISSEVMGSELKSIKFRKTPPISTYVFAFAAGEFAEFTDKSSTIPSTLYVRRSKEQRMLSELSEVQRLNREAIKFFSGYFGRYPFEKYDLVILPEFAYGGMEHAGATFLREEAILFPTEPTKFDLLGRMELIFHEAAHQWFGDLVTMRWFDDLWLKEGFATFMAYKAIEAIMPEFKAWKSFHEKTKPSAYLTDITKGTTPIWQELTNLSHAKSVYGNIVYRKAPSFLRQAEFYLGEDKFRSAIQSFIKEHAFGNAEWADLVNAFEKASKRDLQSWATVWVKRRGMADVMPSWKVDQRGRVDSLSITQRDILDEGGKWPMRIKLMLGYPTGNKTFTVELDTSGPTYVKEAVGLPAPDFIFVNYEDFGYGRFLLDEKSREFVVNNIQKIEDSFLRTLLWGALWDDVRRAELSPKNFIDLVLKNVKYEKDELTTQVLLARLSTAYNRYLSDNQRKEMASRVEDQLLRGLVEGSSKGLRVVHFRTLLSVAGSAVALENLRKILTGELPVKDLRLRSRDRFDLITVLLAFEHSLAESLLARQSEDDRSDDGRRYSFSAGAGRRDRQNKERYFDSFVNSTDIAESWIEAALAPFNHLHHSHLTLPFLNRALQELPELKKKRKIFFVNNWLSAFIGGQCSAQALETVNKFLEKESIDRDLRLKILEVSDNLERCVKVRARYGDK